MKDLNLYHRGLRAALGAHEPVRPEGNCGERRDAHDDARDESRRRGVGAAVAAVVVAGRRGGGRTHVGRRDAVEIVVEALYSKDVESKNLYYLA